MSGHWDAAVEAAKPVVWAATGRTERRSGALTDSILTAALPYLRRHIIAELREKAEAEAECSADAMTAAHAADWLAAQDETP